MGVVNAPRLIRQSRRRNWRDNNHHNGILPSTSCDRPSPNCPFQGTTATVATITTKVSTMALVIILLASSCSTCNLGNHGCWAFSPKARRFIVPKHSNVGIGQQGYYNDNNNHDFNKHVNSLTSSSSSQSSSSSLSAPPSSSSPSANGSNDKSIDIIDISDENDSNNYDSNDNDDVNGINMVNGSQKQQEDGPERGKENEKTNEAKMGLYTDRTISSSSSSLSSSPPSPSSLVFPKRQMNLMWCSRENCKDVVRERVVGEHNQIILNGPATGQVAYRWSSTATVPSPTSASSSTKESSKSESSTTSTTADEKATIPNVTLSSVLLLIKPNDEELIRLAAEAVTRLTQSGIKILLVPELAAKLKHYYGVDDDRIGLFESPDTTGHRPNRHVDDPEEEWVQGMQLDPFPDLVCLLGGDGLLIHASMLFQGPAPPIISIAGGSLGFLTNFSVDEMVDAVLVSLGIVTEKKPKSAASDEGTSDGDDEDDGDDDASIATPTTTMIQPELEVFPPNMPSYPYEPLARQQQQQHIPSHLPPTAATATAATATAAPEGQYQRQTTAGPSNSQNFALFGLGGLICMTIRMRLDCRVVTPEGTVRARYNVLNEVVVDRGSSPYLVALECFCDDVHLTTVQADGVIFATYVHSGIFGHTCLLVCLFF